jgi:hypothetical protein
MEASVVPTSRLHKCSRSAPPVCSNLGPCCSPPHLASLRRPASCCLQSFSQSAPWHPTARRSLRVYILLYNSSNHHLALELLSAASCQSILATHSSLCPSNMF